MRPIELHLKGFTSFKEETVVSFEHLDRFVVCGPTGAGKSSLFDAMTFALFADAPRIDTGNKTDLVSLGRKSFAVTLDFRVGDRTFHVFRARARSGAVNQPDHLLEIGKIEPLASGTQPVNEAVKNLLGLSYQHFTEAVFLPQGKFAEFLRAPPGARRKLLNELLRLLIYDRMREKAGQEKANYTGQKDQTERRLREDFAGVSEEARLELARKLDVQRGIVTDCDRQLPVLRLHWEQVRLGHEATVELEAKQVELGLAVSRNASIAEAQRQAEEASRASVVAPLLDQADAALHDASRRQTLLDQAEKVRDQFQAEHQSAWNAFEKAKSEAESLPALRARLQRLAEAVGKLRLCESLSQQIDQSQQRQQSLLAERAKRTSTLEELAKAIAVLNASLTQGKAALAGLDYDVECHRRLEAQRDHSVRLRSERAQLLTALSQAEQAETKADESQTVVELAEANEADAKNAKRQAQRRLNDTERRLRAAEDAHKAAHLRAGLQPGQPCPVCGQDVARLPDGSAIPELDDCQQAYTEARLFLNGAELALSQQTELLGSARTAAAALQQQAVSLREDAERRRQSIDQQTQLLAGAIGDLLRGAGGPPAFPVEQASRPHHEDRDILPLKGLGAPSELHAPHPTTRTRRKVGPTIAPSTAQRKSALATTAAVQVAVPVEERVLAAVHAVAALSERHRLAALRLNELHNDHNLRLKDQETALADIARLDLDLKTTVEKLVKDRNGLASIQAEIRQATETDDPVAESGRVQTEIDRLQRLLSDAGWAENESNTKRVEADARAATGAGEAAAAAARSHESARQADEAMHQAGFVQPAAVRASYRTPEQLQALQARIAEHAGVIQALQARLAELEKSLVGRRVSKDECRQAEQAHVDCQTRLQDARLQFRETTNQLQSLTERLERSQKLREELTGQERQQGIYEQLARDLRSHCFQAFVLEETLAGLVRDASDQLMRLTGDRYGLFFEDDKIYVIDNDNAAERRGIETLSGGETFLASLSLALALSEQVQKIAGAVHLDCLFIDEGFGALDPETLRTVSDTIRALQVGGRMVGVITHLPDLKEEFDQRILVEKKEGTSRVRVECG